MRALLGAIYAFFIRRRNRRFDKGQGVRHVSAPVISIGNLSVGGTGKTPLTRLVVSIVQDMGLRVAIVSRGYGRKSRGLVVVSDGQNLLCDVQTAGDEVWMLARALSDCIVIASELRLSGAAKAIREFGAECIVLDDGFQHRQLHRDIDIVLVNRESCDRGKVLPAGLLREDIEELRRATIVCRPTDVHDSEIQRYSHAPIFELYTARRDFVDLQTWSTVAAPERAIVVSGIAGPERFLHSIAEVPVQIVEHLSFRDHHLYTASDVEAIVDKARQHTCQHIVCTEKDAVKLTTFADLFAAAGCQVAVLRIESRAKDSSFADHLRSQLQAHLQPKVDL